MFIDVFVMITMRAYVDQPEKVDKLLTFVIGSREGKMEELTDDGRID